MDRRLEDTLVQARGIRDDALADLAGHDPDAARDARDHWHPVVIVRNRAPRVREGIAILEIKQFVADVPVGPGSAPTAPAPKSATRVPALSGGSRLQLLRRREAYDRIESPRDYPDNDLVTTSHVALWVPAVAGYGTCALPLGTRRTRALDIPDPVRVEQRVLDNGLVRVEVGEGGVVSIDDRRSGRHIAPLVSLEDTLDLGDLYTPSLRGGAAVAQFAGATVMHRGPLIGEIETRWRLSALGTRVTRDRVVGHVTIRLALHAHERSVYLRLDGRNLADDHRLRVGVQSDVARADTWADAAFGPVQRTLLEIPEQDRRTETPPPTAPLHRYVSLFAEDRGATLYSDGLAEYESTGDGRIFVTLVRAVGQLSRNDLPERPGHAGWPAPTPEAQSHGPFEAHFAFLLHGPRTPAVVEEIERTADDVLLPLEGTTMRSALHVPAATRGLELAGEGLAFSALKDAEDGTALAARCVNLLSREVEGEWRFGFPVVSATMARLDETPLAPLEVDAGVVRFRAPARAVITILVR